MPGCAAVGCSNRAEKGFLMKQFPKDALQRKQWEIKVHFEQHMWEQTRVDDTRKLKHDVVPTLFVFSKKVTKTQAPNDRNLVLTTIKQQPESGNTEEILVDAFNTEENETVLPLVSEEAENTAVLLNKSVRMPGCAAVGCSNRAEKGFLMKQFPKDALQRKQWEIKVR
ncbi:hypothetical protein FQA39_LY18610 [Lamprigera yunnana]|nr:hypothetical protein FQA39_LY18610 [Lamprigera yunnana]